MNNIFLIFVGRYLYGTEEKTSVIMLNVYEKEKYLQMIHKHK